jgi:adenylate cyclase
MEEQQHTFLFADISGYSMLSELGGDEVAAEVAIRFASEVTRMAAEHGAEVIKSVGDAVMVRCDNAAAAIELGVRLHAELASPWTSPDFPPIHVGIHTGPALKRAGDWWGTTVNITARVTAAAGAGQLLITEAAKRAAGELSHTKLRSLGMLRMKNISAPVCVYAPSRLHRSAVLAAV